MACNQHKILLLLLFEVIVQVVVIAVVVKVAVEVVVVVIYRLKNLMSFVPTYRHTQIDYNFYINIIATLNYYFVNSKLWTSCAKKFDETDAKKSVKRVL